MRLGMRLRAGPFRLWIPLWRSKPAATTPAKYYTHEGCPIHHKRPDTARKCAEKMGL